MLPLNQNDGSADCVLLRGDCLDLMKTLGAESVDLVLTDPPYGMDYQSNRRTVTEKFNKIENDINLSWLPGLIAELSRVLRNNSAIYMFCSWHNVDVFKKEFEKHFKLKNILVWVKNNHGSGDLTGAYAPKHEFILFGHKGRSLFREGRQPDVLFADKVPGSKMVHPTEKPVALLERLIRNNSNQSDTVFDPFMGSGTTGVAALNTCRKFIGVERDEAYFDIAKTRLTSEDSNLLAEMLK